MLARLPLIEGSAQLTSSAVGLQAELKNGQSALLESQLKLLMPWRKGPFLVGQFEQLSCNSDQVGLTGAGQAVLVDTEWRSDLKWDRLLEHLPNLQNACVLDVGGGSGYHAFRAAGLGARHVFNLEPSALFYYQFMAMRSLISADPSARLPHMLPVPLSDAPTRSARFDVVFCMGVLYHRADPFGFLNHLLGCLRDGGTLVLETLVIKGGKDAVLVPNERYAQMNNVYFLPSVLALEGWLIKCGFKQIRCVSEQDTTTAEQRQTDWMQFHSLSDYLDAGDASLTVEGHPAPRRAVILAER